LLSWVEDKVLCVDHIFWRNKATSIPVETLVNIVYHVLDRQRVSLGMETDSCFKKGVLFRRRKALALVYCELLEECLVKKRAFIERRDGTGNVERAAPRGFGHSTCCPHYSRGVMLAASLHPGSSGEGLLNGFGVLQSTFLSCLSLPPSDAGVEASWELVAGLAEQTLLLLTVLREEGCHHNFAAAVLDRSSGYKWAGHAFLSQGSGARQPHAVSVCTSLSWQVW
jgi:hypothetical protein